MPTHRSPRDAGRSALDVFIGEWTEQGLRPDIPPSRVSFEWALDGQFLIQRSEIPQPEFPDSIALVSYDGDAEIYTQHYFDSRGVALEGTFSDDGNSIDARWETSRDGGATWELDFAMTFRRDN